MSETFYTQQPHRRWNPLRKEWILVSPHRTNRPWQGKVEGEKAPTKSSYDPKCYLCPGNLRANGEHNPHYTSTFTFDNDYPAVIPHGSTGEGNFGNSEGLLCAERVSGICRVVCFSPRHDLSLSELSLSEIVSVIDAWRDEYKELASRREISYVMIFENKGEMMGASNPHPHGQIWATSSIPTLVAKELASEREFFEKHNIPMMSEYLDLELLKGERVILENQHFAAIVPFWAVWPFEAMILPKRPVQTIAELTNEEKLSWASAIASLSKKYDRLFDTSFPYSMGVYQKPSDKREYLGFVLRQCFFPPLLRSATVKKFMVGYELCAEAQRDITPEEAAVRLREIKID